MDENMLREALAAELRLTKDPDFRLMRQFGEAQAAHILGVDQSWMKRHRVAGDIPYVKLGPRKIKYFGYMLADILLKGTECLDTRSENSSSVTGGSVESPALPPGTAAGSKSGPDKQLVSALARRTFRKPRTP